MYIRSNSVSFSCLPTGSSVKTHFVFFLYGIGFNARLNLLLATSNGDLILNPIVSLLQAKGIF
jgi:hypothetical protein